MAHDRALDAISARTDGGGAGESDSTGTTGPCIEILLATYNGAQFLSEQLDSIIGQTHTNWRLIVRDDGSTDATPAIIEAFRAARPDKVVALSDGDGNLGLVQNFSRLMEHATAEYMAFCDQDDVWLPEKLALTLAKLHALERQYGANRPLLVFTDLTVVDEALQVTQPSFWCYQNLRPARANELGRVLMQNVVTGCTAIFNRELRDRACPVPHEAEFHDAWTAVVAAALGHTGFVDMPTVLYRQHSRNAAGASKSRSVLRRTIKLGQQWQLQKSVIRGRFIQAAGLLQRYRVDLQQTQKQTVEAFISFRDAGFLTRVRLARRYQLLPAGLFWKIYALFVDFK